MISSDEKEDGFWWEVSEKILLCVI